eukprot:GILI01069290.1.p1 GENE.GILI01069290.1~~GILI01069290.1.p1  ORF type:complete len:142 (+),score=10.76 GILI01069290.1:77-502(+)
MSAEILSQIQTNVAALQSTRGLNELSMELVLTWLQRLLVRYLRYGNEKPTDLLFHYEIYREGLWPHSVHQALNQELHIFPETLTLAHFTAVFESVKNFVRPSSNSDLTAQSLRSLKAGASSPVGKNSLLTPINKTGKRERC